MGPANVTLPVVSKKDVAVDQEHNEERIELVLPPDKRLVRVARLVASGVATTVGFDVEEVEDLRIAVDELCTALVEGGDGGALLLGFDLGDDEVSIVGTTSASGVAAFEPERLALESPDPGRRRRRPRPTYRSRTDQCALAQTKDRSAGRCLTRRRTKLRGEQDPEETADQRFRRWRATGDHELRNELIEEHRWVAIHCARRFAHRGEPLDDLIQVGQLGLLKAVVAFRPRGRCLVRELRDPDGDG